MLATNHSNKIVILERLAQYGTAPVDGCREFSAGLDEAVARLAKVFFKNGFSRGSSAVKFVVGPYGSGKTHFLRHVQEVARQNNCVTAELQLNKEVDYTDPLVVYRCLIEELRVPNSSARTLPGLLNAIVTRVKSQASDADSAEEEFDAWVMGLDPSMFEHSGIAKVLKTALQAISAQDDSTYLETLYTWLGGAFGDRMVCKSLDLPPIGKNEHAYYGHKAILTLYQFIRQAGFNGTVICYDEAEQSFDLPKKKLSTLLSVLQSAVNSISDLADGSAFLLFGITPDVREHFSDFEALRQRLEASKSFFDNNTRAPIIDLTERRGTSLSELTEIGRSLVHLYSTVPEINLSEDDLNTLRARAAALAEEIDMRNRSASNRREYVKAFATLLMEHYDDNWEAEVVSEEDEV